MPETGPDLRIDRCTTGRPVRVSITTLPGDRAGSIFGQGA